MIRKVVSAFILIPLAAVIVSFAVANRQAVIISFYPFDPEDPAFSFALPLYALILSLIVLGVIVGGIAAWLRQGKWRFRARAAESQARELRTENDRLKRRESMPSGAPVPLDHATRLSIPP